MTEVEEGSATALTNGAQEASSSSVAPSNADVTDNAANAAGESQWDTNNDMTASQEWVDVKIPREPSETETGVSATPAAPAAPAHPESWAHDHPDTEDAPAAPADDGFQSVPGRSRGGRDSTWRGGRGPFRGRGGYRGEGRGRGRGGPRGGMPSRPRRGGADQQPQPQPQQ